jgi:uncharacterized protein YegL
MGWAKYQEDIVSRRVEDRYYLQSKRPESSAALPAALNEIGRIEKGVFSATSSDKTFAPFKEKSMSKLTEFTMPSARPLPVIVLADISGSMAADGKIDSLNEAIREMIAAFAEEDDTRAEIHVSIITFGGDEASIYKQLKPASEIKWENMSAAGRTPMGGAFSMVRQLIEDREAIPGRAYRPTIVLVSDGVPTDDWEGPLELLLSSERASKAVRFAMGVGEDANIETLKAFVTSDEAHVFEAHQAREIKKFFQWVTMSVATRSHSVNPDSVIVAEPTDLDDFDF